MENLTGIAQSPADALSQTAKAPKFSRT